MAHGAASACYLQARLYSSHYPASFSGLNWLHTLTFDQNFSEWNGSLSGSPVSCFYGSAALVEIPPGSDIGLPLGVMRRIPKGNAIFGKSLGKFANLSGIWGSGPDRGFRPCGLGRIMGGMDSSVWRRDMLVAFQNFLIDAMYLLAAFLWWKSATAAPQSEDSTNDSLLRAYHELDTAIELVYTCFDPRLLTSNSPFNPHVTGPALFNACAALCTAVAVFLQFIRDFMTAWCEDQGMIIAVMLTFLLVIFLFPLFKYFFRRWATELEERFEKKKTYSR